VISLAQNLTSLVISDTNSTNAAVTVVSSQFACNVCWFMEWLQTMHSVLLLINGLLLAIFTHS